MKLTKVDITEKQSRSLFQFKSCCLILGKIHFPESSVGKKFILKRQDDKIICKVIFVQFFEEEQGRVLVGFEFVEPID